MVAMAVLSDHSCHTDIRAHKYCHTSVWWLCCAFTVGHNELFHTSYIRATNTAGASDRIFQTSAVSAGEPLCRLISPRTDHKRHMRALVAAGMTFPVHYKHPQVQHTCTSDHGSERAESGCSLRSEYTSFNAPSCIRPIEWPISSVLEQLSAACTCVSGQYTGTAAHGGERWCGAPVCTLDGDAMTLLDSPASQMACTVMASSLQLICSSGMAAGTLVQSCCSTDGMWPFTAQNGGSDVEPALCPIVTGVSQSHDGSPWSCDCPGAVVAQPLRQPDCGWPP